MQAASAWTSPRRSAVPGLTDDGVPVTVVLAEGVEISRDLLGAVSLHRWPDPRALSLPDAAEAGWCCVIRDGRWIA